MRNSVESSSPEWRRRAQRGSERDGLSLSGMKDEISLPVEPRSRVMDVIPNAEERFTGSSEQFRIRSTAA